MIVKWTEERIKVIPKNDKTGMIILAPGYIEVEDANWAKARDLVANRIAKGDIVEEWKKITPEQKIDFAITIKDGNQTMAPAKFGDLQRPRCKDIILETYHVPTLSKWLDEDMRQDIRLLLMKQLLVVDKGNAEQYKIQMAAVMDKVAQ